MSSIDCDDCLEGWYEQQSKIKEQQPEEYFDEYELLAYDKGIDIEAISEYSHEKTGVPR